MEPTHTVADYREVCHEVIEQDGEAALNFDNVKARLMARAVARGKEPVAGDRGAILRVISAVKAELKAARERAKATTTSGADGDLPIPDALAPAWEKVKQIHQQALSESARVHEMGAKLRIQQAESDAESRVAELRRELESLVREIESHAGQLDQFEISLNAERASVARLTGELAARARALEALDEDARAQFAHVQQGFEAATAARIAAEERAHEAELAQATVAGELKLMTGLIERMEVELAQARSAASDQEARARDAERARNLAQGRLSALEEECARLRERAKPRSVNPRTRTSAKEKVASTGGR